MKKTLIAVAALAATGAFAQNVTVYGRLDVGYAATTNSVGSTDTKASGVQSHNSVSSFWGLKGSEDLGGGMNAFFVLEQDIYPADGNTGVSGAVGGTANSAGFNRVSLLGVNGGFGSVAMGRDYVPTFKLIAGTDPNGLTRLSTVQLANGSGNSSQPNLVFYSTPDLSGFKVNVAYGNQDTSVSSQAGETSTKITNITATYTNGPLMVGLGSGTTESKAAGAGAGTFALGNLVTVTGIDKSTGTVLAATYDFGKVKLWANMINSTSTVSAGAFAAGDYKTTENNIAASMPLGKITLVAQFGQNKLTVPGAAEDYTGTDWVVRGDYALSARTALYLSTGTYGKLSGNGADIKAVSTAFGIKTTF